MEWTVTVDPHAKTDRPAPVQPPASQRDYPWWPERDADLAELQAIRGPDADAIAQRAMRKLEPGLCWQAYMDKCPGEAAFALACRTWKATSPRCRYVAIHGTSAWLSRHYAAFAALVVDAGLIPLAIAGMDSTDETGKAHRLGELLLRDDCHALGHDLEGKGEDEKARAEWAHAMEYVRGLVPYLRQVPGKAVFGQFWPVPFRVRGLGGHWGAFPWEPYAAVQDADAPQFYDEDWPHWGTARHAKCLSLFRDSRSRLNARLASQGLKRAEWVTIQSGPTFERGNVNGIDEYLSWSDRMPVILWAEWTVSPFVLGRIAELK